MYIMELGYTIESHATKDGHKASENYLSNPYAIVVSKVIDMENNDSKLNRELISKIAVLIARFEDDLTNDCGISYDAKPKEWRYQRNKSTVCRANSLSLIRKKKFDYIRSSFNSFK